MKLWEIFRFEVAYQTARVSTWSYYLLLFGITFLMAREVFIDEALAGGFSLNSPFAVAQITIIACILALLSLAALAGGAAARDVETRMHPILYTAPIGKGTYLGGRFLATFALSAILMSAITAGLVCAALLPGDHADLLSPIRPLTYLSTYFVLALPNAFIASALMFSAAVVGRRGVASYLGGVFLFFAAIVSWQFLAVEQGLWQVGRLTDPLGLTPLREFSELWTADEKNTLLTGLQMPMILNRILWIGGAAAILGITCIRFQLAHIAESTRWGMRARVRNAPAKKLAGGDRDKDPSIKASQVRKAFGGWSSVLQTIAVARESFRLIMMGSGGIALAALFVFVIVTGPLWFSDYYDIPELPTTGQMAGILENAGHNGLWLIIPLLIVYYAGELVWREREAGLGQIIGAAPIPVWSSVAGKFTGLAFALVVIQVVMMAAGMILQARLGYFEFEPGLYAQVLLGLRLTDHLLFAILAFVLHIVLQQKYVAHLIAIIFYVLMTFGQELGMEPGPWFYGSDPGWSYSDMRGLDPFFQPWLLFKLYWAMWAVVLAVAAKLLWPRGTELHLKQRLRAAGHRFTRRTAAVVAIPGSLIFVFGSVIVSNMNVHTDRYGAMDKRRAEYERHYAQYAGIPQPRLIATNLHMEIHPDRRAVEIRGTYHLVNRSTTSIDSVHIATAPDVEIAELGFNVPSKSLHVDNELGHRIHVLETPLRTGDSLQLTFAIHLGPNDLSRNGDDLAVVPNGTYFGDQWLPSMGYQRGRELHDARQRKAQGLPPRPAAPPLDDPLALMDVAGQERVNFEAVVGTSEDQIAVAPGSLRSTWTENGRRYFHYCTDAPILNNLAFFSANYAIRKDQWQDVDIHILHHPGHTANIDRMVHGVQATLEHLSPQLGPYPYHQIRLVEVPGNGKTLFAHPTNISYREGFALLDPGVDPRIVDIPFATVAHEVAHHWWGHQLVPAQVGGAALLTESLAWYCALEVVEAAKGHGQFQQLLQLMREEYLSPRALGGEPLLRSIDGLQYYRKGPLAMYAIREYVGKDKVNSALRDLLERHGSATPPLPTPLDLYRELRTVTPDTLQYLLHDLFASNTFWDLRIERATARPIGSRSWQVSLEVVASKQAIDPEGIGTEVPMNDWVEIGIFAAEEHALVADAPIYRQLHRIRSGKQTIVVTVLQRPASAGIDPRHLLMDLDMENNESVIEYIDRKPAGK